MTRLAFMSDLHIDSNQFGEFEIEMLIQTLQAEKIDHLHMAGDISNDFDKISRPFIEQLRQHFPVTYNLGNHDMLSMSEEQIQEQDFQLVDFGPFKLLSLAGWYDYSFVPDKTAPEHLKTKQLYWFDRRLKRSLSDPALTEQILDKLDQALSQLEGPIIIALHFVPHDDFILRHPYFERFNAFLGSPRFHEIFKKYLVKEVIFGHTHHRFASKVIDGIRYHARPLGYIREWQLCQNFLEDFLQYRFDQDYHPYKHYRQIKDLPEFIDYKKKHLANEFRSALTIVEL